MRFQFIFLSIILLFLLPKSSYANDDSEIFISNLGIQASNKLLDEIIDYVPPPKKSHTGKSYLTVNKMGFDILSDNPHAANCWVIQNILEFAKTANNPILDVGSRYGYIPLNILSEKQKVIANDMESEHLVYIRKKAQQNSMAIDNLYLNNKHFPSELSFEKNSLSAVILHRVLHFLSPEEIQLGLAKVYDWLVPGGKVFIVVMAPQHKDFSGWFLPIYDQRWEEGDKWPGVNLEVKKALPAQAYNLPEFLHVMDERPLKYILEKQGFEIEKVDFVSMQRYAHTCKKLDGHEAIGVIAVKK